jgi:hypothetical protein
MLHDRRSTADSIRRGLFPAPAPHTTRLKRAPDPDAAAKVTREQIVTTLQRAGRRRVEERAGRIHPALNANQPRVPVEMVKRLRKHADGRPTCPNRA